MSNITTWSRPLGVTVAALAIALAGCEAPDYGGGDGIDLTSVDDGSDEDGDDDPGLVNPNGEDGFTESVTGYVHDPHGIGLAGVRVTAPGGYDIDSDDSGLFVLPEVPIGEALVMTFEAEGYATTQGGYTVYAEGSNFFSQTMAPVDLVTNFDSGDGVAFTIDDTHTFNIPADSIVDEEGNSYDGNVTLQATVWDHVTSLDEGGEFLASPGDGLGTEFDGEQYLLYTYGMFQLELVTESGEQVGAGPGFNMQVEVPADSGAVDNEQIPYWDYDEQDGTWVEEDAGQIVDIPGGGQVWEFEPTEGLPFRSTTVMQAGNPDKPIYVTVSGSASGTVVDSQGYPLVGAQVRIIASDRTYMVQTQTNSAGTFSAQVPPWVSNPVGPNGRPISIEVDYQVADKPALWRGNPIAPPGAGGVADFGEIKAGSMTCLTGTVVDASGLPVAGVEVASPHGGNDETDSSGAFCMEVPKWQPSTVYAVAVPDAELGFQPIKFRPTPDSDGSCDSSCPNVVQLGAYQATSCASGRVMVSGEDVTGLRVETFDPRFPSAAIYSTTTGDGDYCVTVPADMPVAVRVGAGVLANSNACGSYGVEVSAADTCDGGDCAAVPAFDCGL